MVDKLPGGSTIKRIDDTKVANPAALPGSNIFATTQSQWAALQAMENQPQAIFGDGRVYTGVSTSDAIRNPYGMRFSAPVFEQADQAMFSTWEAITSNPVAYEQLKDVYRLHYRKKPGYEPSPNQLMSLLTRAVNTASTAYANEAKVTVSDVLNQMAGLDAYGLPVGGYGGGSGGGGTASYVTQRNESDVRLIADALAQEMIGRSITEDEFAMMLRKVRRAENNSPRVVTTSGNSQVTKEGISDAERQEVLQEVLREKPEWQQYQMTHGVLDAMSDSIRTTEGLDSGV